MLENALNVVACIDSLLFFPVVFKILDVVSYEEESDSKDLNLYLKVIAGLNLPFLLV